MEKNYVALYKH